jgi:PIN domain nuclease of toxin-antitoxin system
MSSRIKILLDTHIYVWWRTEPERLSKPQLQILSKLDNLESNTAKSDPQETIGLCDISLWEIAMLVRKNKLTVSVDIEELLQETEENPLISILPITARIAAESVQLGDDFHKDPADRIIVATARCLNLNLLTADSKIREWGKVIVI